MSRGISAEGGGHTEGDREEATHMASKSRAGAWNRVRLMAWNRDRKAKAPCHICGQSINYHLEPSSTPLAWEPDHVFPVSKRPDLELDLSNIKASHKECNRNRGDGTNGENAIGMQSRVW